MAALVRAIRVLFEGRARHLSRGPDRTAATAGTGRIRNLGQKIVYELRLSLRPGIDRVR